MPTLKKNNLIIGIAAWLSLSGSALAIEWPPVLGSDPNAQPPKWDWQLEVPVQLNADSSIEIYDIDMFDNESTGMVGELHSYGKKVICYVDVGSWEDFRDDADDFPDEILGATYYGFPDERWLDIRDVNPAKSTTGTALADILRLRLDRAMNMGCDGVEPDNMDVYDETAHEPSGFPLTYEDQIFFNLWVADEVHSRGMAVGLKNDINQAKDPRIVEAFDFVVSEECVQYGECSFFSDFIAANKPVFLAEYSYNPDQFCSQAKELRISAIKKRNSLDSFRVGCDDYYDGEVNVPEKPGLVWPVNGTVPAREIIWVGWTREEFASNYHVQVYDRRGKVWSDVQEFDRDSICGDAECWVALPAMQEQRSTFWRVKALNSAGSSGWTNFRDGQFNILEEFKPPVPQMSSPLRGDVLQAGEPVTLTWAKVDSAQRYQVQRYDRLARSWSYKEVHLSDAVCGDDVCSVVTPAMDQQPRVFWRVSAYNSKGFSGFTNFRETIFDVL